MSGKRFIVVVDDDDSVRRSTKRLLKSVDFECHSYASADEFLDPSKFRIPDVMLLDLTMPGMDGFGLLRRLTNQGFAFPVIIISAHDDDANRRRALHMGAAGFLAKPFTPDELIREIKAVLIPAAPKGPGEADDTPQP
jgi:FixJ family two-component response regulator